MGHIYELRWLFLGVTGITVIFYHLIENDKYND